MHAVSQDSISTYVPEGEDGTKKYPQYHRLIGKTIYGKVVDVIIPPDTAEAPHTHCLKSVMFTDQPTAITVAHVSKLGQEKIVHKNEGSSTIPSRPLISMMDPEPFHYVRNCDREKPYRAIRIELKCKSTPSPDLQSPMKVPGQLSQEDNLVRIWDIAIKPGRNCALHSGSRPGFLISDLHSVINVWKLESNLEMDIVKPYEKPKGEIAERPKVWAINKRCQYQLLNASDQSQRIYCLEIKA